MVVLAYPDLARNIIALYVVPPLGNGELLCDRSEEV